MISSLLFLFFVVFVVRTEKTFAEEKTVCPEPFRRYSQKHSYCQPANKSCEILAYYPNPADILKILELHNKYRSSVATGKEGLSSASDMLQLQWDDELAAVAQKYAEQCLFEHDCANCRRVTNFGVGQNIAMQSTTGSHEVPQPDWSFAISEWFSEIKYFPKSNVCPFKGPTGGEFRHFSQLVWAKTFRVGCGYVLHKTGSSSTTETFTRLYFCNYGPDGNMYDVCMYKAGKPCSNCPANSCCGNSCGSGNLYPGLCKITDERAPNYPPTQTYLFYCDFGNSADCNNYIDGIPNWLIHHALGGNFLGITLNGGEKSTIIFKKIIKPNGDKFCITLQYRKGPNVDGNLAISSALEVFNIPSNSYTLSQPLPDYDQAARHQFSTFNMSLSWSEKTELKLSFAVPSGKPSQFFDVKRITAVDGSCKNT